MNMKQPLIGALVAGVILFVWSGVTQALPWGVPSANVLLSQAQPTELFDVAVVKRFAPNELTTAEFDTEMVDKVNTLTTEATFSWIITKPLSYYDPTGYLLREFFTQLLAGVLLAVVLSLSRPLALQQRLTLVGIAGLLAAVSTYGQLYNWWGLTVTYALGVSFNLIVGWMLAGFVLARFILKSERSAS